MRKETEYAMLIIDTIANELADEESSLHRIGTEVGDNANEFFYALSTLAPLHVYNKLTGEDLDPLEFNHVMNRLIFQFAGKEEDK